MSDRRIGDGQGNAILEYAVCANACTGAPAAIQPGAVVALAEALELMLGAGAWYESALEIDQYRDGAVGGEELERKARAALALYNGAKT